MKSKTLWIIVGIVVVVAIIYIVYNKLYPHEGIVLTSPTRRTIMPNANPSDQINCPSTQNMQCSAILVNTPNGVVQGCRCIVVGRNSPQFVSRFIKGSKGGLIEVDDNGVATGGCTDAICQRLGAEWYCGTDGGCIQGVVSTQKKFNPTITTVISHGNGNPAMG